MHGGSGSGLLLDHVSTVQAWRGIGADLAGHTGDGVVGPVPRHAVGRLAVAGAANASIAPTRRSSRWASESAALRAAERGK